MLTSAELAQLEWSCRSGKALSVYLDGTSHDPAQRTVWRRELDGRIADLRDTLRDVPCAEREAFDQCVERMVDSLAEFHGALRPRGWVGFFPEQGVAHTEVMPVHLPMIVAWEDGLRVAPYVRALKQHQPAIVAVVDARMARIHRHVCGTLTEVETLRACANGEASDHMGHPPRQGFHPGTHGGAGADEKARERRGATADMLRELAHRLTTLAGAGGWILVGGIPRVVDDALSLLPHALERRVYRLGGLDVHATHAQISEAAERGTAEARREHDLTLVTDLLARHGAGGHGIVGFAPTLEALHEHAADCLYFTDAFLKAHPHASELLVRTAFEQHVRPEYVCGTAAERLDVAAGGVGAALRFVPLRAQPPLAASSWYEPHAAKWTGATNVRG